ncbi:hypothetical protein G6F43_006915 [Rhizopus delemar]|nr:hypothetical protein G6F43_006915 [Rhizopus delemar]
MLIVNDLIENCEVASLFLKANSSLLFVGFQGEINGTISITPSKRALEETEEDRAESSKTPQNCHSNTTNESFKVTGPSSNYGELFKQRRYILELSEFDDISLKSKVSVHSKDNELSLDEKLLLSSINYYNNCPVELLLQPCAFSDQTYTEIRKWRQSRVTKTEYFPSHLAPNDPPTEKDIFQRNLGVFLVNLTETLDRLPIICNKKQSEIDYSVQNISTLLRFVFNSKSKVNITYSHQELSCGEVKVVGVGERLQDEDRARLGERWKKQLHHRIKKTKSEREFYTFGVFIIGNAMELYRSSFSKETGCDLVLLSEITLPTLKQSCTSLEESLEILFSFKVISALDTNGHLFEYTTGIDY